MIKYNLPEIDYTQNYPVYVGDRKRYATSSAMCFIDKNTILVAGYLHKKVYLVDISENKFKILDELPTNLHPDLMDYKDGLVLVSCRYKGQKYGTIIICKIINNKIIFEKEIIKTEFGQIHGCRIINNDNFIITVTSEKNKGCYFINRDEVILKNFKEFDFLPKDVFIDGDLLFISTSNSLPSVNGEVKITNSKIYVFNINTFEKIDELEYYGQSDCIVFFENYGFITLQGQNSLLYFTFKNNKLEIIKLIEKFNFPHGVGFYNDLVGITNYGDNSVDIYDIEELIKD